MVASSPRTSLPVAPQGGLRSVCGRTSGRCPPCLPADVQQLGSARGESCQVLTTFIDIRGLSKFAGIAESSDTAIFLRDMYSRVLTHFFAEFTYAKPTGDGLMIVRELATEVDAVEAAGCGKFSNAVQLVKDFPGLTDENV